MLPFGHASDLDLGQFSVSIVPDGLATAALLEALMARPSLFIDRRTPEEVARDHQKWVNKHWLEPGRRYTFETSRHRINYNLFGAFEWGCYIKQVEWPYEIVAYENGFGTRWGAERWGKAYLKRGGPPGGFFDPPPPDPNEVLWYGNYSNSSETQKPRYNIPGHLPVPDSEL